jgi:hypothetical protein
MFQSLQLKLITVLKWQLPSPKLPPDSIPILFIRSAWRVHRTERDNALRNIQFWSMTLRYLQKRDRRDVLTKLFETPLWAHFIRLYSRKQSRHEFFSFLYWNVNFTLWTFSTRFFISTLYGNETRPCVDTALEKHSNLNVRIAR